MQRGQAYGRVTSNGTSAVTTTTKGIKHSEEIERKLLRNPEGKTVSPVHSNDILFHPESKTILDDDDPSLDSLPYSVRKDLLVRELESSLAEMDDYLVNTSKLEEEKSVVEVERNSLLREIDGTISEIQDHVKNAKELEKEKRASEEQCIELRSQVKHLKQLLENQNGPTLELKDHNENHDSKSIARLLEEADGKNRALEKEINQLRFENEELSIQIEATDAGLLPNGMDKDDIEALRKENEQLQKLLEMSEESEDNLSQELRECEKAFKQLQSRTKKLESRTAEFNSYKQQWEEERDVLEEELDRLKVELERFRGGSTDETKKGNKHDRVDGPTVEINKSELDLALAKTTSRCSAVEKQLVIKNRKIESLELEIKKSKQQRDVDAKENSGLINKGVQATQQLRAALEKLNKENATLQDSLEKAEKEASSLKAALEAEKAATNDKVKSTAVEKDKTQKAKTKVDKTEENYSESNSQQEALQEEKDSLKSECKALSETVTKVVNEKRVMDVELSKLKEDKEQLSSIVSELKISVKDLDKIKTDKQKLEEVYIELRALHDDLQEKQTATNSAYQASKERLESTLKEKNQLENRATNLEDTIRKLENEISVLRQNLTAKSNELSRLTRTYEEESRKLSVLLENKETENRRLKEESKINSSNLKKTEAERRFLADANQSWEPQIKNLRVALDDVKRELHSTRNKNSELEIALKSADERAKKSEGTVHDLRSSSAKSSDMAMEKSLELSKTKRTLEKKIEKLMKENVEIKKKIKGTSTSANLSDSEHVSPVITEPPSQLPSSLPPSLSQQRLPRSLDTSALFNSTTEAEVRPILRQKRRSIDEQLLRSQRKELYANYISHKDSTQSGVETTARRMSSSDSPLDMHHNTQHNVPGDVRRDAPERVQVIAREERPLVMSRSQTGSPSEWTAGDQEVIHAQPLWTEENRERFRSGASEHTRERPQNVNRSQTSSPSDRLVDNVESIQARTSYQQYTEPTTERRSRDEPVQNEEPSSSQFSSREQYDEKSWGRTNGYPRPQSGLQYVTSVQQPPPPPSYGNIRRNLETRVSPQQGRKDPPGERLLPSYQDATRSKSKGYEGRISSYHNPPGQHQGRISPNSPGQYQGANPLGQYQGRISPNPPEQYQGRLSPTPPEQYQGRISPNPPEQYQGRISANLPRQHQGRISRNPPGHYQDNSETVARAPYNSVSTDVVAVGTVSAHSEPVTARVKYKPMPAVDDRYVRTTRRASSPDPPVSLKSVEATDRHPRGSSDVEQADQETGDDYQQPNSRAVNEHWV